MSKPDEFPIMINDIKRIASLYKLGNLRSGDSIVLDSSGTVVSVSRISGIKSLALRIPIGINSASIKDLEALPGIGPKLAGRIVEYRNLNGPFKAIDELRNIDGIEEKKLEYIKPLINLD
jgi:competence protein ComEA